MWNALESYHNDGKDVRVVRPDHPVPPSATLREITAWMAYVHTKPPYPAKFMADRTSDLRRYIAKTDYYLRAIGIW